jgi:hypothetical protein
MEVPPVDKLVDSLNSLHRIIVLAAALLLVFAVDAPDPRLYRNAEQAANLLVHNQRLLLATVTERVQQALRDEWRAATQADKSLAPKDRQRIDDIVQRSLIVPGMVILKPTTDAQAATAGMPPWALQVPLRPGDLLLSQLLEINWLLAPRDNARQAALAPGTPAALDVEVPLFGLEPKDLQQLNKELLLQKAEPKLRLLLVFPPQVDKGPCPVFIQDSDDLFGRPSGTNYFVGCKAKPPLKLVHTYPGWIPAPADGLAPLFSRMNPYQPWSDTQPKLQAAAESEGTTGSSAGATDFLGAKMSSESMKVFGPLILLALLAQVVALTSLANSTLQRRGSAEASATAVVWFGMFGGWRIVAMLTSVVVALPAGAILAMTRGRFSDHVGICILAATAAVLGVCIVGWSWAIQRRLLPADAPWWRRRFTTARRQADDAPVRDGQPVADED